MSEETNPNQSASIARGPIEPITFDTVFRVWDGRKTRYMTHDEIFGDFAKTNAECAAQATQDRLPTIDEELHAASQLPGGARRLARHEILARAAQIEKERSQAHINQRKPSMSQTNESSSSCGQVGRYDPRDAGRICTSDAQKSAPASQVQALLNEGGALLNELNEEIYRTCRQFEPVLMPPQTQPEKAGSQPPHEIRSELADTLAARNETLRSQIGELRAINNRSTVAP